MALAAPVEKDGFFFAGDALYCEASNLNRHRRATVPELKAHFNGKNTDKDRPAHWYEAQLLHYGLPPSKVKGTAHKRLFDAVMKGGLSVPSHIQKIETDLKKEWNKREREAKKMMKESTTAAAPKAKTAAKRKADQVSTSTNVSVNVSFQVSNTGQIMMQAAAPPAAKKAKIAATPKATPKSTTTKAAPKATSKATPKAAPKAAPKPATKATASKTATPAAPKATPKALPKTAPKTTLKAVPKTAPKTAPKITTKATPSSKSAKPTAKGKAMAKTQAGYGSTPSKSAAMTGLAAGGPRFGDAPPPYAELDPNRASSSQPPKQHSSPSQPKLGLLNGRYTVRSRDLHDDFGNDYMPDFGFIATLDTDRSRLWLKFDFGAVSGIMELNRPWGISDGRLNTVWRGTAPNAYCERAFVDQGTDNSNWVEFVGDGHVRGTIRWGGSRAYQFEAQRLPDQPMRSEISPSEMRMMFEEYGRSEEDDERAEDYDGFQDDDRSDGYDRSEDYDSSEDSYYHY